MPQALPSPALRSVILLLLLAVISRQATAQASDEAVLRISVASATEMVSQPRAAATLADSPAATSAATPAAGGPAETAAAPAFATATPPSKARIEFLYEIDPYYSSAGIEIPLTADGLPDGGRLPEVQVYRQLLRESFMPRLLMLEASVYPLPILGTSLKKHHRDFYDNFTIGDLGANSLNVLEGLTAGFQEPWALSVFVGTGMSFSRHGERPDTDNRAYMGYLLSGGKKHIRSNTLIDDDWWELEWKLKGERQTDDSELSWSFRIGVKNHGNPDIVDVALIGIRRSSLDYKGSLLSFLTNSTLESMTEINRRTLRFLRQEITIGRKIPLQRWRVALELDLGFVYEDEAKYRGKLTDPDADAFTFIFRPNIKF